MDGSMLGSDRLPEDLLRPLVEQSLGLMCVHDLEGNLLFVNAAAAETLGYRPADGVGWNLRRFLSPDIEAQFGAYLERIRTAGVDRGLLRLVAKDGMERVWSYRNVLYTAAGRSLVLGHAQDVTDRIRAERALKEAHARRVESLGVLAGGIAHEFNNLLTVIIGRADLLGDRLPDEGSAAEDVVAIRHSAERAAHLTQELLAFGRRQKLEPRLVNLNELVGTLSLATLLGPRIELTFSLDDHLHPARVDPGQVARAVVHLAENARDAMPEGGRLILETANVEMDETLAGGHPGASPGPYVRLTVRDTGAGLDEAARSRIFEPFFTARLGVPGSGLALAAVHGIAAQHGGSVTVESAPDRGTVFAIYLPAALPAEPLARSTPSGEGPARETVLIIEEDAPVRLLLRDILTLHGYRVLEARGAAGALTVLGEQPEPVGLLLTRLPMGQAEGADVSALSGALPGVRRLYLCPSLPNASRPAALPDARTAMLQMPFNPAHLLGVVRELLDRRSPARLTGAADAP